MCLPAMMLVVLSLMVLSLIGNDSQANAGEHETKEHEQSTAHHTVTGTLTTLDLKAGKGMLKTDLGKPLFFNLVRPDLFQSVSVGQRVSVTLTEDGQVVKVMEAAPAELPGPAAQ
ncbi:MAG: hypothetical protein ACXWWI_10145 [Nitrospira sp.]